jgi:hypothetical protein
MKLKSLFLVLAVASASTSASQLNLVDKVQRNISGVSQDMMNRVQDTQNMLAALDVPFSGEYALTCGNKTAAIYREQNRTTFVMDNKVWGSVGYNTPGPVQIRSNSMEVDTTISVHGVPCDFVQTRTVHHDALMLEHDNLLLNDKVKSVVNYLNVTRSVDLSFKLKKLNVRVSGDDLLITTIEQGHKSVSVISRNDMQFIEGRYYAAFEGLELSIGENFVPSSLQLNGEYPDALKKMIAQADATQAKIDGMGYNK